MLRTDLLFDFGSAALKPEARLSLLKLAAIIQSNSGAVFRLIGHTDNVGTEEANQTLSEARAAAVKSWLVETLRLDGANILTEGRGERELLPDTNPNGTAAEQAQNRRVEIHKTKS
jgi:outer membrane protein OmpA-like peptidoglycan-associated protein